MSLINNAKSSLANSNVNMNEHVFPNEINRAVASDYYNRILDNPGARYVLENTVNPYLRFVKTITADYIVKNGTLGIGAVGPRNWRRSNSTKTFVDKEGNEHTYDASELFGLPVHNRVILDTGDENINGVIFDDAIITISKTKNIIKTYLPGYAGSVKEHMYDEDYNINIVCSIADNQAMSYNKNKLITTIRNLQYPDEILISNEYLNECFDIHSITITDFAIKQSERFSNISEVTINAVSFAGFLPIAY